MTAEFFAADGNADLILLILYAYGIKRLFLLVCLRNQGRRIQTYYCALSDKKEKPSKSHCLFLPRVMLESREYSKYSDKPERSQK